MLNGSYGNFCLKTQATNDEEDYNSSSWSSNTKNFIVLKDNFAEIHNWKKNNIETVSIENIRDNTSKFYGYIASNSYKTESDIVPFVIDIFRQLRNLTQEKSDAIKTLNLLFILLISLEEDISRINFKQWGLVEIDIPSGFDQYVDIIKSGIGKIRPRLDLIIRHSSGILFQEAQKEVLFFDPQLDLWGFHSKKLNAKKNLRSSLHYTPPYLARAIVENAIRVLDLSKPQLKIFDPACGSGEFLIEALKQLKEIGYSGNVKIIGWDSSATAVNTSNFLLNYEHKHNWPQVMSFHIENVENSLGEKWDDDYDLILMNPPFTSWVEMDTDQREAVKDVLGSGRPNQASAFFYKSIQSLNANGVIGCVIPSSLLVLDTYSKLRDNVYDLISINLIARLGLFVFEDALTDTSLIIGCKPKANKKPLILWTKNEAGVSQTALRDLRKLQYSNSLKAVEQNYSIYSPVVFPIAKKSWKVTSFEESELFKSIERFIFEGSLVRVQDIFNVQQGIRTGNNNVFKITENEYFQLSEDEKKYFRAAIDNESIKDGEIVRNNYVWYPYNKNGILIHTEEKLKNVAPNFYQTKLAPFRNKLIDRCRKNESTWWELSEPRTWLRKKEPRLISTEFGGSDSFAFDKEGAFVIERGNAWIPKKEFKDIDCYYFYLAIFSSPFFDSLLSVYSRELAGFGCYDLGKKYTGDIPIPDILSETTRNLIAYRQLIEIGKELSNGNHHLKGVINTILLKYFYPKAN